MKFSRELSVICYAAALLMATPGITAAQSGLAAQQAAAAQARAAQQAAAQAAAARAKAAAQAAAARAKAAQQAAAQAAAARAKAAQQAAAQAAAARAKAAQQATAAQAKAAQQAAAQAAAAKAKAAQQAAAQAAAAKAKAAQQAAAQAGAAKAKAAQQAAAKASPQTPNILSQPTVVSSKPNAIQPKIVAPNVAQPKVVLPKPNAVQPKIATPKPAVVAPASASTVSAQKPTGGTPSGGEVGGSGSSGGGSVAANPGRIGGGGAAGVAGAAMSGSQLVLSPDLTPSKTASGIKVTLPTQQLNINKPSGSEAESVAAKPGSSDGGTLAEVLARLAPHLTMKTVFPPATDHKTTAINSNQAIPLATIDRTIATTLNPVARLATEPTQDAKVTLPGQLATTDNVIATPFNSTHLAPSTVLDTLNLPILDADSRITPRANSLATTFSADQLTNAPSATLDLSATKGVLNTQEGSKSDRPLGGKYEAVRETHTVHNGIWAVSITWCQPGRIECVELPKGVDPSMRYFYTEEARKAREAQEAQKEAERKAWRAEMEAANAPKNMWNAFWGRDDDSPF